jgi:alpha-1,6-mannosyltransferase
MRPGSVSWMVFRRFEPVLAPARRIPRVLLAAVGTGLVLLNLAGVGVHRRWDADYGFVAVALLQGALYLVAAALVLGGKTGGSRKVLLIVIPVAAGLRLTLLFEAPLHSTDIYRYVWDGRVQAAGLNPYRYVPANPALGSLRDEAIFPKINRAEYAVTVYPPVAEMSFYLFTRLGEKPWAVKLGWLALEAVAMAALVRLLAAGGRPASHLLLYAWHPLSVWEIAADGHVDAGMMALLIVALWAAIARRRVAAGVLMAASCLFKPLTVAALPAFWRPWDWRLPLAFVCAVAIACLPYISIGDGVIAFLPTYIGEEGMRSGQGFLLLQVLSRIGGPPPAAAVPVYWMLAAGLLTVLALACIFDKDRDVTASAAKAQLLLFIFLLVLSPNYPWYFVVLVPSAASPRGGRHAS